jgi:nucleoid-associated protein YgaU
LRRYLNFFNQESGGNKMAEEPKKNIFNAAIDAISNRDEKAAAEAAKKQAEAAMAEADAAKAELAKAKAAADAAQQNAATLRAQLEQLQQQQANLSQQATMDAQARQAAEAEKTALGIKLQALEFDMKMAEHAAAQAAAAQAVAAQAAAVIKHVWTKDDTYASLAQKYYGSFKEPYWRLIYDHNKAIIGDHPNAIRVGLEIEIPPLPEELKKK